MPKILIVEDSKLFGSVLQEEIKNHLTGYMPFWAKDYSEAEQILDDHKNDFFISLLDLNLPDAPNGEIVDLVLLSCVLRHGLLDTEMLHRRVNDAVEVVTLLGSHFHAGG